MILLSVELVVPVHVKECIGKKLDIYQIGDILIKDETKERI